MLALSQGLYDEVFLMGELKGVCQDDIATLLDCIKTKPLKYRNRAVAVLSHFKSIRVSTIASFLGVSHSTVDNHIAHYLNRGGKALVSAFSSEYKKIHDDLYTDAVFSILHSPYPPDPQPTEADRAIFLDR